MKGKKRLALLLLLLIAAACFFAAAVLLTRRGALAKEQTTAAMTVTILDVGQGSSTLVQAGNAAMLIDCGEESAGNAVCEALRQAGVKKLDAVIVTHLHSDHYGGLADVLEKYPVGEIIEPETPTALLEESPSYERMLTAVAKAKAPVTLCHSFGMRLLTPNTSLTFLDGFLEEPDGLNNTSLCLRFDCKNVSLLITGDAETAVEDRLRETDAEALSCDLLVAGHHGSATSSRQYFLNAVRPMASFVSVGLDNDYNLPNARTLERLSAFGKVYRTDWNGTVSITTDGDWIYIQTEKGTDTVEKLDGRAA